MPEIILCQDPGQMAEEAIRVLGDACKEADGGKTIRCVLTGGRTPARLHELMKAPPYRIEALWPRIHFFWGDERCVPPEDPRSNSGRVLPILRSIPVPEDHLHPIPVHPEEPEKGAAVYEKTLRENLSSPDTPWSPLDLVYLGLGEDGHTASLFPGSPALWEMDRWVVTVKRAPEDFYRISLTFPILNHCRRAVFLVSGDEKASILKEVLYAPRDPWRLPAQGIHPAHGRVQWIVDREAAAFISAEVLVSRGYRITSGKGRDA
jgi:6-phosphogluconolactonase